MLLLAADAGVLFQYTALASWLPSFYVEVRGMTLSQAGFVTGLIVVSTVPTGPVLRGPTSIRGVVVGVSSTSADIAVSAWAEPGERWTAANGRVRARFPERSPPLGASVIVRGDGRDLGGPLLPGAPDPVRGA